MITVTFQINGTTIPIHAFNVSGGAHGSTGSCEANTSIKMLSEIGFDLAAAAQSAGAPMPATLTTTDDINGAVQLFNGNYVVGKWDYVEDEVSMQCRDKAGDLVDQKRVMTQPSSAAAPGEGAGGVNNQNNKLSGFVQNIASMMGLTAQTNLTDDPLIGTLFGDNNDTIQLSAPQTLWGFLTKLARDTGNIVYATPQGNLYFGPEGQGQQLNLIWRMPASALGGALPLLRLSVEYNGARNSSHTTRVSSYDRTLGKTTSGVSTKKDGKAKYTFHTDGLTQAQAQKRADSISKDIARHEIIAQGTIDYTPWVKAGCPATLMGQVDPVFSGFQLYVSQFIHGFRMSEKNNPIGELFTEVTLLKQGDK